MKDKTIVGYCMTCHKIRLPDGSWGFPEGGLDSYSLSHTYCPPCLEITIAEIASDEKLLHEMSGIAGISRERKAIKQKIVRLKTRRN